MNDRNNWQFRVFVTLSAAIATALAQYGIYRGLIVPRLDHWLHIPLGWWAFACSPILVTVFVLALWRKQWWFAVAAFSTVGISLVFLAGDAVTVARGLPVAHDTFSLDRYYFFSFGIQVGVIFILLTLFTCAIALPSLLRGTVRPNST